MKRIAMAVARFFTQGFTWLGIGSILWLIVRSGTKPSRITYPCQRAAAGTGTFWLGAFVLPGIVRGLRASGLNLPEIRLGRWTRGLFLAAGLTSIIVILSIRLSAPPPVTAQVGPAGHADLPVWIRYLRFWPRTVSTSIVPGSICPGATLPASSPRTTWCSSR